MKKMTPEIKEFILSEPSLSSYVLKRQIKVRFGVRFSHTAINAYRRRVRSIENEYLLQSDTKKIDMKKLVEDINGFHKSKFKRYWESTLASALVDYLKARKETDQG